MPSTVGHAFISYVREDAAHVDRLQAVLEAAGIRVWRDTEDLWPGQDWKLEIRQAIQNGSLAFLACFSDSSNARDRSFQNEELLLAVEQMRQRPPGRSWLIPIRFSDCTVPDYDLGAGRTLSSFQRVDLFADRWERGGARLVSVVLGILSDPSGVTHPRIVQVPSPEQTPRKRLKTMLLDPNRQIELEDLVGEAASDARRRLLDETEFPPRSSRLTSGADGIRYVVEQARRYEHAVGPLTELLAVGCTWGRSEHNVLWARTIQLIANTDRIRSGQTALIGLQRYPLVIVAYGASLAAVYRGNFACLKAVTTDAKFRSHKGTVPVIGAMHVGRPFSDVELAPQVLAYEDEGKAVDDEFISGLGDRTKPRRYTPVSDHLFVLLRPIFADLIPDDQDFLEAFDELEVYLALIATDAKSEAARKSFYLDGPWFGSFTWRHEYLATSPVQRINEERQEAGSGWPPVKGGLFGGNSSRAEAAFDNVLPEAQKLRRQQL